MTGRFTLAMILALGACAPQQQGSLPGGLALPGSLATPSAAPASGAPLSAIGGEVETLDPDPPPPPAETARTVEEFDTTTEEDRDEAVESPPEGDTALGTTLATLGSPAEPGIWVKTPLVSEVVRGRVEYRGASINVELRPTGGEGGSGSQISLAAMRLIEAPLTEIVELTVYR